MIRIYISGPMTGIKNLNKETFAKAEKDLRQAGYEVMNPWLLDSYRPEKMTWAERVRDDIKLMMICNAVAVLPGWLNSRGARLETDIAHALGWKIKPVNYYLRGKK